MADAWPRDLGSVLRRGDWYHRRGKASDLCTKEWSKLPPELQAEYVKVQTLDDLGDQVRVTASGKLAPI